MHIHRIRKDSRRQRKNWAIVPISRLFWDYQFQWLVWVGSHGPLLAWVHSSFGVSVVYPWFDTCRFKSWGSGEDWAFGVQCQLSLLGTSRGSYVHTPRGPLSPLGGVEVAGKHNLRRTVTIFTGCVMHPKHYVAELKSYLLSQPGLKVCGGTVCTSFKLILCAGRISYPAWRVHTIISMYY